MAVSNDVNVYDDGYLRVEFDYFYLACRGAPIYSLGRKEFLIFACLLRAKGRPVQHQAIWQQVWQEENINDPALRVHINSLRRKLKPYGIEIHTMVGVGYYLRIEPQGSENG
ncbi:MAG: helix-turn-helix domain-containing protein [Blastocatellia bacterium]